MTLVGRHIGRYRILEQLGSGGMSVVYKGLDTALDREVAVKVLHPHLAVKDESRRRLAREARAVAKLHHPNILEVFDFSAEDAGDAFIVTEYIRGQTLRAFWDKHGLQPPEVAAMVVHELAAALAHAHEAGVIHRDLKPENAMVREDGVLKLMDFGIAKVLDRDERMTVTGALVGSPAHMAPEIIEGLEAGPAADVFSLGTMLYAFATGTLPFMGPNTPSTLRRILDGAYQDPRAAVATVSDELADIIARALARDPAQRYPDAAALRVALGDYLAGLGVERVSEEVATFFVEPDGYRTMLVTRLVGRWLERARGHADAGRHARALACLNIVLAHAPEHAEAHRLLRTLDLRRRRARRLGLAARAGAAVLLLGGAGLGAWHLATQPQPPTSAVAGPPAASARPPAADEAPAQPAPADAPGPTAAPPGEQQAALDAPPAQGAQPAPTQTPKAGATTRPPRPVADARTATRPAVAPAGGRLAVLVQVRPYGIISVDGGPPTPQPLAQHALELAPGRHTITVTCAYCEVTEETIEVRPGSPNVFRFPVLLRPSHLVFDFRAPGARVRVGDVERATADTRERPVPVYSPVGPKSLQHQVTYEVSAPGHAPERRVLQVTPGQTVTVRGELRAE